MMHTQVGYGSIGLNAANPIEAVRQSHVDRELSQVESIAGSLEIAVNELASRISPILNIQPDEQKAGGVPEDVIAPLADRIRDTKRRLEQLQRRLTMLTMSVEL